MHMIIFIYLFVPYNTKSLEIRTKVIRFSIQRPLSIWEYMGYAFDT